MGDKTGIEWTDATWNPIRGCSRVSDGCRNCYAETVANRFKGPGMPYEGLIAKGGQWNGKIKVVEHLIDQPLRWRRPRRIFVNSMSDLFHENVPDEVVYRILDMISKAHWHTFQVLTKRPDRAMTIFGGTSGMGLGAPPIPNLWLGVSAEDQATADERIPLLLEIPAAVHWVSAEPLLGPLNLERYLEPYCDHEHAYHEPDTNFLVCAQCEEAQFLRWVVVGGESGGGARPMHPAWVQSIRDQCTNAAVPFLFKQWGEWAPDCLCHRPTACSKTPRPTPGAMGCMFRCGKQHSGRLLNGRTWDQYPGEDV